MRGGVITGSTAVKSGGELYTNIYGEANGEHGKEKREFLGRERDKKAAAATRICSEEEPQEFGWIGY